MKIANTREKFYFHFKTFLLNRTIHSWSRVVGLDQVGKVEKISGYRNKYWPKPSKNLKGKYKNI